MQQRQKLEENKEKLLEQNDVLFLEIQVFYPYFGNSGILSLKSIEDHFSEIILSTS